MVFAIFPHTLVDATIVMVLESELAEPASPESGVEQAVSVTVSVIASAAEQLTMKARTATGASVLERRIMGT